MKDNDVLTITKEAVRKMADACPEAKKVLRAGLPDAFKDEWVDITRECSVKLLNYCVFVYYMDACIGYLIGDGTWRVDSDFKYSQDGGSNYRFYKRSC